MTTEYNEFTSVVLSFREKWIYEFAVRNTSALPIPVYIITCKCSPDTTLDKITNFDISVKDDVTILTPSAQLDALEPAKILTINLSGYGTLPTSWKMMVPAPKPLEGLLDFPSSRMLELVAIAENSTTKYEATYNYSENILDKRGITSGICGFLTGNGYSSMRKVLLYYTTLGKTEDHIQGGVYGNILLANSVKGGEKSNTTPGINDAEFIKWWNRVGASPDMIKSQHKQLRERYWVPAIDYCKKKGLKSLLAQYIMYDTSVNIGGFTGFDNILPVLPGADETVFLTEFLSIKQEILTVKTHSPASLYRNRVIMQRKILSEKNFNLSSPMYVSCYGDDYVL
jgi:hypothetical protein